MCTQYWKNESDNTLKSTSILVIAEHSYYNQHLKQKNYKYNKSIFFHNRFRDKQQFLRSHVKNALNNWMWYETKVLGNKKENWNIEGTKWKFSIIILFLPLILLFLWVRKLENCSGVIHVHWGSRVLDGEVGVDLELFLVV